MDRLPSLSLSRWMRRPLRSPSGRTRGSRKQVRPPGAWASDEEQVAHGRGAEPLVPGEQWSPRRRRRGLGAGGVRPHVRTALLLGHGHAGQQAVLGLRRRGGPGRSWRAASSGSNRRGQRRARAAARERPRRSSRSGSRGRPRPAPRRRTWRRGRRAHRAAARPRGPRAGRGRPRCSSARARRGGTRPRRSGCPTGRGCAAPAGARWRAWPARRWPRSPPGGRARAARRRPSRRPRRRDRLQQRRVVRDVIAGQRRHLVADLMRGMRECHHCHLKRRGPRGAVSGGSQHASSGVQAALGLARARPAAAARVGAGLDPHGAGRAADRRVALIDQRVDQHAVARRCRSPPAPGSRRRSG